MAVDNINIDTYGWYLVHHMDVAVDGGEVVSNDGSVSNVDPLGKHKFKD